MKDTHKVLTLNISCAVIIFAYGYARCRFHFKSNDPIKNVNIGGINGWSMSHFLFNAAQGYMFPNQWRLCFILGVAWELLEYYLYNLKSSKLSQYLPCRLSDGERWVYPDAMDIVFNASGLAFGIWLRKQKK